ncbi:transient receptor potential cation channel subfamily A member 1 isoform X2 [Anthonomus grandis grandis]|uniref:transient receptor potential cation channel subfamily A member 1 isoform X2 n=1 Tax=Anthonomus grandis grandis TaxID=2921223 RepID=UPI0021666E67|nr:transient receptor potential cation channel subfamily A member 1 isoform X2 [Anthonomus grandis grandis]
MPNLLYVFQLIRSWRLDEEDNIDPSRISTPIITVLPAEIIDPPDKKPILTFDNKNEENNKQSENKEISENINTNDTAKVVLSKKEVKMVEENNKANEEDKSSKPTSAISSEGDGPKKNSFFNWLVNTFRSFVGSYGTESEKRNMLPSDLEKGNDEKAANGGCSETVCSIAASPYRILRAAESGNLDMFQRLYIQDPSRLSLRDPRGRTTAHQAASRNRVNILTFIVQQGGDMNAQDNAGNTPLHVAVESESLDAIDYLLSIGVKTDILNEKKQAPVHLATELSKISVLETMAKHKDKIHIQQGGEHGRTALHIAAIYDHDACARILISDFGASPRKPCNNGYYPIHEAAKNASSKTMEVFLAWGESLGCTREEMISFYDAEGNVPLHSAVHGGDIKAVELCIRSGAKISTQQHDLSTPVHLACAQGAIEIVKIMFQMQPEEKLACLTSCDIQKMTPLHCAAMFDHPDIVEYLISEGADRNAIDKERRSPLLLAALRGGWKTVHTLIRLGADINIKDINKRNVLHLVVMNGGQLEQFASEAKSKESLLQLLNEKDLTGCSPLHYASREGHIKSLENLIRLGACINLKNNNNESPLHFAARYGRYNTVKQLLDSEKGNFIINESDGEGMTPLHIASQQGHTKVVQLLLNRGALLHRDHNGRNPLHLAAMNGYTQTIELLLSVHSHLLDQLDKDGNTALHLATMENRPNVIGQLLSMKCKLLYNQSEMSAMDYAIYYKYLEAALAMVTHEERAEEIMALKSPKNPCVSLALIASMPRVFEAVQDKCIIKANCKKDSKLFSISYNFSCLQCSTVTQEFDEKPNEKYVSEKPTPLPALNAMVAHGRVELLAHPLSQKYLQMKWNSYGKYCHLTNLLFYCMFLGSITCFSSQLMQHEKAVNFTSMNFTNMTNDEKFAERKSKILNVEISYSMYICALAILVFIAVDGAKGATQMLQQKYVYFFNPVNWVTWFLYGATIVMVLPIFGGEIYEIQFSFASLVVFLSWFQLLLLLQSFDQVGIYVVMFLEILQTLIKVLMVFSILIIAFGLAFYILLSRGDHLSFKTIPMALIRTFSMMLGEIDFLGTYVKPFYLSSKDENTFLPFPIPAFLILGLFMVLMPILLMNLLIGLAVGDIESVRRNAQLKRLAMQVVLHTELERRLPRRWLEKVDKDEIVEYPNESKSKKGIVDYIVKKWFGSPFSEDGDIGMDNSEDYVMTEITKTKNRLRQLSQTLEQQNQFLRLIIQKMEIKTEADDIDEGVTLRSGTSGPTTKWTSPRIRKKLKSVINFSHRANST